MGGVDFGVGGRSGEIRVRVVSGVNFRRRMRLRCPFFAFGRRCAPNWPILVRFCVDLRLMILDLLFGTYDFGLVTLNL